MDSDNGEKDHTIKARKIQPKVIVSMECNIRKLRILRGNRKEQNSGSQNKNESDFKEQFPEVLEPSFAAGLHSPGRRTRNSKAIRF